MSSIIIDPTAQTYTIPAELQINAGYPVQYDIVVKNGNSVSAKNGFSPGEAYVLTPTGYTDMVAAFPTGDESPESILARVQSLGLFLW